MKIDVNDNVEVTVLQDIYKSIISIDKETNQQYEDYKLVKKGVRSKKTFRKDNILSYEQDVSPKGIIYKNKFRIQLANENQPISVVGRYEEFKDIISSKIKNNIGFKI